MSEYEENIVEPSYGVIYLIINNINKKIYIGQTTSDIPKSRWYKHIYCANHSAIYYFGKAIKKYGAKNFSFKIIKKCKNHEDLNYWEIYYIDFYDSRNRKKGYNIKEGGSHGKHSEETKEKLRVINTGKTLTKEHKLKLSQAHLGKKHSKKWKKLMSKLMTGKKLSSEHCKLISIGKKGKKFTKEHKKNISISKSGENSSTVKLNWAIVNKARTEYKTGKTTLKKLSQKYNVCESNMRSIISNHSWIDLKYDTSDADKIKISNKKHSGESNPKAKLSLNMVRAIRAEKKIKTKYYRFGNKQKL